MMVYSILTLINIDSGHRVGVFDVRKHYSSRQQTMLSEKKRSMVNKLPLRRATN